MSIKLFDSEMKVMKTLWEHGDLSAKQISQILNEQIGWHMNTTYTVIKKCIEKGAIERSEPNFMCHALINMDEVRANEVEELVDKLFYGSPDTLFATLLNSNTISREHLKKLRDWVNSQVEEEK